MKTLSKILVLALCLSSFLGQAQILPKRNPTVKQPSIKSGKLTLAEVKNNISRKKNCYQMAVSVSFTEKPINSNFKNGPELGYATATIKQESTYLKNHLLLRSDHDFSGAWGNRLEVIAYSGESRQVFRFKTDTHSGLKRTLFSSSCHLDNPYQIVPVMSGVDIPEHVDPST